MATGSDGKHVCMLPVTSMYNEMPPTVGSRPLYWWRVRQVWGPSARHHGAAQFVRSARRLRAERARPSPAPAPLAHPYSALALCWQAAHMLLTCALFVYMPLQVFMHCPNPYDPFILLGDIMSFVNILASFATGYVDEDNKQIVMQPKLIAKHYLTNNFILDLIGTMPLQIIQFFDNCVYPSHTVWYILKLCRIPTFAAETRSLLEQLQLSYITQQGIGFIMKMILFFHWMTFIHYQVPCFTIHYFDQDDRYKVWLKRFTVVNINQNSVFQKYTANLFLVCGLCIGAGYYSPVKEQLISELLLTSLMGLIGLIYFIYSFSAIFQLAIYRQYDINLFNARLMELKEYMNLKRLPKFLQRKIQLFINYKFNGHYFNEDVIMNTINEQIKQDINMYGCKKMVMSVPLFQDMPISLINAIIFSLTQVLYMPGEILVKYGEEGSSLYMISSGTVAVINSTGREIAHLRDGSYFGETALLRPGTERAATIVALEITEIYKLESKQFQICLQPHPHLKRRLEDNYMKRRQPSSHRNIH